MRKRIAFVAVLAAVAALAAAIVATAAPAGGGFTNFSLGPAGVTCPASASCTNGAAEPSIRADGAGRLYGASENGLGGGTLAWRSTDGGQHYTGLASPN